MGNIPPFSIGGWVVRGGEREYWLAWGSRSFASVGGLNLCARAPARAARHQAREAAAAAMGINVSALRCRFSA